MRMIQGVHHIAVKTTAENYRPTVNFYTTTLGLPVKQSWGNEATPFLMLSCGDGTCMEILPPMPGDGPVGDGGPLPHVAFATDQVDAIVEAARAAGLEITTEPRDGELCGQMIRTAFLRGAAGEVIELFWVKG